VSFSEYYKVQEQLKQAMYKLGELQEQLHAKEELIAELRAKLVRRWWEFWK
jgi:predicted  nucleic acid-binding Zn-ribbon protein